MRFFYDCEFLEDGRTIELISLGMVREDGEEFYGVNQYAPWGRIATHPWLVKNVVPHLPPSEVSQTKSVAPTMTPKRQTPVGPDYMSTFTIRDRVAELIGNDPYPELWAHFGAYDHVVLAQLWGSMVSFPKNIPMWTHDLNQEIERVGVQPPAQPEHHHHHALGDARWVKTSYFWLQDRKPTTKKK